MSQTEINTDRLVLVDIETTGLNELNDLILEVGFRIVTPQLDVIDEFDVTIWDSPQFDQFYADIDKDGWVYKTHTASGLWQAAQEGGLTYDEANNELVSFLKGHGLNGKADPMVGSSVHFDRTFLAEQMPDVAALFHYRNIDISSIKEMCRRMNPEVYAKLDTVPKQEKHRALPDLEDTTGELRFYMDNFMFVTV